MSPCMNFVHLSKFHTLGMSAIASCLMALYKSFHTTVLACFADSFSGKFLPSLPSLVWRHFAPFLRSSSYHLWYCNACKSLTITYFFTPVSSNTLTWLARERKDFSCSWLVKKIINNIVMISVSCTSPVVSVRPTVLRSLHRMLMSS